MKEGSISISTHPNHVLRCAWMIRVVYHLILGLAPIITTVSCLMRAPLRMPRCYSVHRECNTTITRNIVSGYKIFFHFVLTLTTFLVLVQTVFGNSFSSISTPAIQQQFIAALINSIINNTGTPAVGNFSVQLNQTSSATILANVFAPTSASRKALVTAINNNLISFALNSVNFLASFGANYGPCPAGSISQNGWLPGCTICPNNTYVSHLFSKQNLK